MNIPRLCRGKDSGEKLRAIRLIGQPVSGSVQETSGHYWIQAAAVNIAVGPDTVAQWSDPIPQLVEVTLPMGTVSTLAVTGTGYIYSPNKVTQLVGAPNIIAPTNGGNLQGGVIGSRIWYSALGATSTPIEPLKWMYNATGGLAFPTRGGTGPDPLDNGVQLASSFYNNTYPIVTTNSTWTNAANGIVSYGAATNFFSTNNFSGSQNLNVYSLTQTPGNAGRPYFIDASFNLPTSLLSAQIIAIGSYPGLRGEFAVSGNTALSAASIAPAVWAVFRPGYDGTSTNARVQVWFQFPSYSLAANSSLVAVCGSLESVGANTASWLATRCQLLAQNPAGQLTIGMS